MALFSRDASGVESWQNDVDDWEALRVTFGKMQGEVYSCSWLENLRFEMNCVCISWLIGDES
jgi:hypothetical protein